jgi:hypothetical protein
MSDPERMDLSALDPARDSEHWSRLTEATRVRIEAILEGRSGPSGLLDVLAAWSRPLLAAAAILVMVFGLADAAIAARDSALDVASGARRLAALSDVSLGRGLRPTGPELMVALRSRSAR